MPVEIYVRWHTQNPRKEWVVGGRAIAKSPGATDWQRSWTDGWNSGTEIENGDQPNDVGKWSLDIEKQVVEYEQITEDVRGMVKSLHEEALLEGNGKKKKWKRRNTEEEELKLEEANMEIKREFEKKLEEDRTSLWRKAVQNYSN